MRLRSCVALVIAAALLGWLAMPADAQRTARCRVTDPTGTPLNVRLTPQGRVVGTIRNGALVRVVQVARDGGQKPWAYIVDAANGQRLGWVFREFISCY